MEVVKQENEKRRSLRGKIVGDEREWNAGSGAG